MELPGGTEVKNPPANAVDEETHVQSLGRSFGIRNDNPLQYSFLQNSMDREAWWAISSQGCKELDMTEQTRTIKGQGQTTKKTTWYADLKRKGHSPSCCGLWGAEHHQLGIREAEGVRSKCGQEVLL